MLPKEAGLTQQETYPSLRRRPRRWQRRSDATGVEWNTPVQSLILGMVVSFPCLPASLKPADSLTFWPSLLPSLMAKPEQVGDCPMKSMLAQPAACQLHTTLIQDSRTWKRLVLVVMLS